MISGFGAVSSLGAATRRQGNGTRTSLMENDAVSAAQGGDRTPLTRSAACPAVNVEVFGRPCRLQAAFFKALFPVLVLAVGFGLSAARRAQPSPQTSLREKRGASG